MLKSIELASTGVPGATVVLLRPKYETFTVGVPVMVRPVAIAVSHTVMPAPLTVMFPDPKPIERVFVVLLIKAVVVNVYPSRSMSPLLRVKELLAVSALPSLKTPLGLNTATLKVIVLPALLKTCVPAPKKVNIAVPEVKTPTPRI